MPSGVARVETAAPVQSSVSREIVQFNLSDIGEGIKEVTVKVTDLFYKYTYGTNALTNKCSSRTCLVQQLFTKTQQCMVFKHKVSSLLGDEGVVPLNYSVEHRVKREIKLWIILCLVLSVL